MSEPTSSGATQVTMEEMAAAEASEAAKPTDLTKVVVQGDDVPEELRGKTAAEAIAYAKGLKQALGISEQSRLQAQQIADIASRTQPVAAVVEAVVEPELTDEQLQTMFQEEPLKAIRAMNAKAIRDAERNVEARLAPLFSGTSASVEKQARETYKDEFALFGSEISKMVETTAQKPNGKNVLANPAFWDDMISYIRGKPGNFDKMVEAKTRKVTEVTRSAAQEDQVASVGFTDATPTGRARKPMTVESLDSTQREIAGVLGISLDDYVKWSKVG